MRLERDRNEVSNAKVVSLGPKQEEVILHFVSGNDVFISLSRIP